MILRINLQNTFNNFQFIFKPDKNINISLEQLFKKTMRTSHIIYKYNPGTENR